MKGRKPVPTTLKLLRGNPGKRTIARDEPRPPRIADDTPPELTDEVAREEWRRLVRANPQITVADRALAIAHCELWATWRSQVAAASASPHVLSPKHGTLVQNPARNMANKTLGMLTRIDCELGLSPVSRARVATGDGATRSDDDAELDRILAVRD